MSVTLPGRPLRVMMVSNSILVNRPGAIWRRRRWTPMDRPAQRTLVTPESLNNTSIIKFVLGHSRSG